MKVYIDHDIDRMDVEATLRAVSEQRRLQALRYRQERDRRLSLAAYVLLCRGLREVFAIDELPQLVYPTGGKPHVEGHPRVHFSLSHCREAALCTVAHHPVGADVESIRPYDDTLAARVLSDDELRRVRAAERPDVAFIKLWTMKEALLKLTGEGITRDLRHVLDDATTRYRFATVVDLAHNTIHTTCQAHN